MVFPIYRHLAGGSHLLLELHLDLWLSLPLMSLPDLQKSICIWEKYHMSFRMANCKTWHTSKFEMSDIASTDTELFLIIRIISRKSLQWMQNDVGIEIDENPSLDELQAVEVTRETAERSRAQRVCDYQQKGRQPYAGKDNFEIKV